MGSQADAMDSEFKHLEDFLAAAIVEKAAHPRSARIRALIHLAKVTRAEVVSALADVEKRIDEGGREIVGEAESQRFFGMVLIDLGAARGKHLERLLVLDEIIARAQKADG
jgi:hypothetical protein